MSQTTTPAAPRSARPRQSARPTPLAPPVTTADLPVISICAASRYSASRGRTDCRVGPGGELRVGLDQARELLARLVPLSRNVLGRPEARVRLVALENISGDGHLVHLVDAVRDRH